MNRLRRLYNWLFHHKINLMSRNNEYHYVSDEQMERNHVNEESKILADCQLWKDLYDTYGKDDC